MSAADLGVALLLIAAGCLETPLPQMTDPTPVVLRTYLGDQLAPLPFVAAQAGDGPWTRIESDDGVYQLASAGDRYAVAHMCKSGNQVALHFLYATATEHPEIARGCPGTGEYGGVAVDVVGLDGDDQGRVSCASETVAVSLESASASFSGLLPGSYDLFLALQSTGVDIDGLVIERGVEVSADSVAGAAIDREAVVAPTSFSLAVAGALASETVTSQVVFLTTRGTQGEVALGEAPTGYLGLPPDQVADDELYRVQAAARDDAAGGLRVAWRFFHDAQNLTLPLPSPIEVTSVAAAETEPYVRPAVRIDAGEGAHYHAVIYQGLDRSVSWNATRGWLGEVGEASWEQPDLSHLDGWDNGWALADNVETSFSVSEMTGDVDPSAMLGRFPESAPFLPSAAGDGSSLTSSTSLGEFTP